VTVQPETGYPASPQGWQQTPPEPAPGQMFSGYSGDAPSGLQFTPPAPTHQQAFPGHAGEAPPGPGYGAPPPGYAAQPAAYAEQRGYAPPPQAAYPDPALDRPADQLPGYLQPFPPPGGFSGKGPSAGPVVAFTIFFGVFGMISAWRRAKRAEAVGDNTGKYWMAFGVTLALGWVVGAILSILSLVAFGFITATASSATATPNHTITAAELSQSMEDQGTFTGKGGKVVRVKTASCAPTSVDANGAGTYKCAVSVTDGTKYTLSVRADSTSWHILGTAK
jgi:hypothetical protein